jgi:hypothetical protein
MAIRIFTRTNTAEDLFAVTRMLLAGSGSNADFTTEGTENIEKASGHWT